MKDHLHDVGVIVGVLLVAFALSAIYWPLGVAVIGAGTAAWGWIGAHTEALEAARKRREASL